MNEILDGRGYFLGDVALAILITLSACLTYARIAFEVKTLRFPFPRAVMAVGWTMWAMRFWWSIFTDLDVIVAPISMVAIAMVASGYSAVQLLALRRAVQMLRTPIFCFQNPEIPCQREDRLKEAILEDMRK